MKKVAVIILIILYFTASIGATIRMHFCMGVLVSWTLNTKQKDDKCNKCGMQCNRGCCEEKSQVVKIDKDQKLAKVSFEFSKSSFPVEPTLYQKWQVSIIPFTAIKFLKTDAPRVKHNVLLFARNGAFLI